MEQHICDCDVIHEEVVDSVRENLQPREAYLQLASLFKMFGDGTRVRILHALEQSEMCVCDIARLINMTQSAVSHQLRVLKQARLVKARRSGKTIFYSLCDDHVQKIIHCAMDHVME